MPFDPLGSTSLTGENDDLIEDRVYDGDDWSAHHRAQVMSSAPMAAACPERSGAGTRRHRPPGMTMR